MTGAVIIRKADESDASIIASFNIALALETENKALDPDVVAAGVRGLLRNPGSGFYVVADQGGFVAACLMITTEWSDWRNGTFWWIQSVFVHQDFRRRGLYRQLYNHVLDLAQREGGICGFRLYVEKENHVAQATYRTLGMEETSYRVFENILKTC